MPGGSRFRFISAYHGPVTDPVTVAKNIWDGVNFIVEHSEAFSKMLPHRYAAGCRCCPSGDGLSEQVWRTMRQNMLLGTGITLN
jgi:trehalose utilization protein